MKANADAKVHVQKEDKFACKEGETKEEHFERLSKLPKTVLGKKGNDAWFHFDELYDGEE